MAHHEEKMTDTNILSICSNPRCKSIQRKGFKIPKKNYKSERLCLLYILSFLEYFDFRLVRKKKIPKSINE